MAIMTVNTWVITAGVRLHGRTRAIPDATQATPTATMTSITMNAIAFEVVQASPDAESITLSMTATTQAGRLGGQRRGGHEQHRRLPAGPEGHSPEEAAYRTPGLNAYP